MVRYMRRHCPPVTEREIRIVTSERGRANPRSPTVQAGSFNDCTPRQDNLYDDLHIEHVGNDQP